MKIPLIVKELLSVRSARAYGQFVATHFVRLEQHARVSVQVVATKASLTFFKPAEVRSLREGVGVWTDEDEWDVRFSVSSTSI